MSENALQFKDGNPGAVQYGNFINYYQFHPPENRISLLPTNIWKTSNKPAAKYLALDIGCNAGNLTFAIKQFLQKHIEGPTETHILGVDIDPVLIQRANEAFPQSDIEFQCVDCTESDFQHVIQRYLAKHSAETFNSVFCFSITMWIHLNKGDEGLKAFLANICQLGELLVLEPQPWKCYRSAVKRMNLCSFPHYQSLKMRSGIVNDIEIFIQNELHMRKLFESNMSPWDRKIVCYQHETHGML